MESFEDFGLKIGNMSCLNVYMKIFSLITMATQSFHRLIMGKIEKKPFTAKVLQIFG